MAGGQLADIQNRHFCLFLPIFYFAYIFIYYFNYYIFTYILLILVIAAYNVRLYKRKKMILTLFKHYY